MHTNPEPHMTEAQRAYRLNSGDLRSYGRFAKTPEARAKAIKDACYSRAFWYGNRWVVPASLPAQAALTVVSGKLRSDPLECAAHVMPLVKPQDRPLIARVVLGSLHLSARGVA
jgi:hypothetical protein